MGTLNGAIVLKVPVEILGPGSDYEKGRIELKKQYDAILAQAKKVEAITTSEEAENANNLGRMLQAASKDSESFFKPIKQQIDSFKKPVLEDEKKFTSPIDEEKRRLGSLITEWNEKLRKEREEEERKAREAAEKAAREEMLARAIELEQSGETEAAEHVLEEPIMAPVIVQSAAPVKVSGQVEKTVYKAQVIDVKALLKAVLEGRAPMACITVDEGFLNRKAGLDKEGFNVPGCRLIKSASTHFRT